MNPHCLICYAIIPPIIGWTALLSSEREKFICPTCEGKLEEIHGKTCRICSRPFHLLEQQFRSGDLCHDCVRWEEDQEWSGFLDKNISIFQYNDFLKDVIARFKFRGDYLISKVFAESIKKRLNALNADLFVPIPLSNERLYERGFNQAEAILFESGFLPTHLLSRVHSEKQSKKTRAERIHLSQVFQICDEINIEGKKIVLIDDIYTTGSTLRHAAKLLKGAGAESIQSITLAR
ncbi:ComF family protein [Neobacillus sp. PS3-40]|uniref:ComF family protein n=1 Tax=Neobacillus sp. PS3-40 TaxID=3070679 RepID=UPI0027E09D11|nr:ComF family protein [Neobacillus sp. PS3-40]WML46094.1 ComF family protein [Neobacillus sp. PS3-40]